MNIRLFIYLSLLRLRPSILAVALKKVLHITRRVFKTDHGCFWIDPVSNFGIKLLRTGHYEPELTRCISQLLTTGCTFVDIGANEGYYCVQASSAASRILAVEPQQRLKHVLETNFELNGVSRATILQVALSDKEGTADLSLAPDTNSGSSGLTRATRYKLPTQETRTIRLQTLLDENGIRQADLVKMDIEGFEYEAILGSPRIFQHHRIRALCLELHPTRLERRGLSTTPITDFLERCGYVRDMWFQNLVYISPAGVGSA